MFIYYNANPEYNVDIDCTVRAISVLTDQTWDDTYIDLCIHGFKMKRMPNNNAVWGSYLKEHGYFREAIPGTCPDCYTIQEFVADNPRGKYMLATGNHVVPVIDGNYYDTWDSGNEIPIYFWKKIE